MTDRPHISSGAVCTSVLPRYFICWAELLNFQKFLMMTQMASMALRLPVFSLTPWSISSSTTKPTSSPSTMHSSDERIVCTPGICSIDLRCRTFLGSFAIFTAPPVSRPPYTGRFLPPSSFAGQARRRFRPRTSQECGRKHPAPRPSPAKPAGRLCPRRARR